MGGALVGLMVVALGINAGWQPLPEGGSEYIIQIEPHMLERLRDGETIQSDILPEARGVRSFRVVVGTDELPRKNIPVTGDPEPSSEASPVKPELEKPVTTPGQPSTPSPSDTFSAPGEKSFARPKQFPVAEASRPLTAEPALFEQEAGGSDKQTGSRSAAPSENKPWLLFWAVAGTAFGLFAAFLYLLWIHWETRNRYRALLAQCPPGGWPRADQAATPPPA